MGMSITVERAGSRRPCLLRSNNQRQFVSQGFELQIDNTASLPIVLMKHAGKLSKREV